MNSLVDRLRTDYPSLRFEVADEFLWSSRQQTIYYNPAEVNCDDFILHELSHALLDHSGYRMDIELLKLERDAWEYAQTHIAPVYRHKIDETVIQDNLDTYRDWLHARSTCPDCESTGLQVKSLHYRCLACSHSWRVNEARLCALRRYSLATK